MSISNRIALQSSCLVLLATLTTLLTASTTLQATAITIYPANDGFELPGLNGGYQYSPGPSVVAQGGSGWTFNGSAGIAANGSGFGVSGASNTNQNGGASNTAGQAAVFQNGSGAINDTVASQSVSGFLGLATLTFDIEQRNCCDGSHGESVNVYVDNSLIGNYTTTSTGSFVPVTTAVFAVGGTHTITFSGVASGSGDSSIFVDNVSISTAPEPGTLVLFGLGVAGLLVAARRSRGA